MPPSLRRRIFVPLTAGVLVLSVLFAVFIAREYRRDLAAVQLRDRESVAQYLESKLQGEVNLMDAVLQTIVTDDRFATRMRRRDRDGLLRLAQPIFRDLAERRHITHLYFTLPNRVNLVRVHRPEQAGDTINRFTTREAQRTGAFTAGLELGRLRSLFTLRAVMPWDWEGERLGYVELGEEIDYFANLMRDILGLDVFITIDKQHVTREYWEAGMRMFGREADWDQLPSAVVSAHTMSTTPPTLAQFFPTTGEPDSTIRIRHEDRRYAGGVLPLVEVTGRRVGHVVFLRDFTQAYADSTRSIALVAAVGSVVLLMLAALLQRLIRQYIFAPLHELRLAAGRAGRGELGPAAAVTGGGEMGELAGAINLMIAELREAQEEHTRKIVDAALDAVITVDATGQIAGWNAQAEQMFGWSAIEVIGREFAQTVFPDPYARTYRSYLDRFVAVGARTGLDRHVEVDAHRKDGAFFPAEVSVTPIRSEGRVLFSVFVRDITQRREAEASLLREITHRRAAEAESEAKSQFVANMSHEIRTPMNGVLGMAELLLHTDLTNQQRGYANKIVRSAEGLMAVLNDVLDFSKIEAGKLHLESVAFDLQHVIEDVADLSAINLASDAVEITVSYDPTLPRRVVGDPSRVRQVLTNLVGNAIKFTTKGHIALRVEGRPAPPDRFAACVTVEDTGVGIATDRLDHVFDEFTQADSSTARQFGGTGLGLAISKRLVGLMGGEIGVRSQEHVGSEFWFTLDLSVAGGEPEDAPDRFTDLRVLVVDDLRRSRDTLHSRLSRWGIRAQTVGSAAAALDALRQAAGRGQPFDIALIDQTLPDQLGHHLGGDIAGDPALDAVKLVLMTTFADPDMETHAAGTGIVAHLIKPVGESALLDTLLRIVHGTAERVSGATPAVDPDDRAGATHHRPRVLLVDDNEINRELASEMLDLLGCDVDQAPDGRAALRLFDPTRHDLVFMDCQMPVVDGYDAAKAIRREETGERTPIIALTAHAMPGEREKCLAAGMDDHITKPVTLDTLRKTLAQWCGAWESIS